ncbi:MAG: hybrid sensor histidine kinase/response regulator [Promethearchaeota archaeon]
MLLIKEEFSKLFQMLHEAVLITDAQGIILYTNPALTSLLSVSPNSLLNKPIYDELKLLENKTSTEHQNYLDLINPTNPSQIFEFPTILLDSQGQNHYVEVNIHDMNNFTSILASSKDKSGFLIQICDRSKQFQLQEVTQKNIRLKSLSTILGGLAHDFNNILTAILGNVGLAKLDMPKSTEIWNFLSDAEDGIENARKMTERLLIFSIEEEGKEFELINLNKILKETVNFTLSGSNVFCNFDVAEDLWSAKLDKTQINQAIYLIILTAVQAMPIGGTIDIVANNVQFLPDNPEKYHPGAYIRLSFQDQGIGIRQEDIPFIFDPFTNHQFGGQKIDFSLVKSIVDFHKGYIEIQSKLDEGTQITLLLPAEASFLPDESRISVKPPKLSGKILIMDDEEIIRLILSKILSQLGFEVYTAANGEDTLMLYQNFLQTKDPFRAVILDLTIRGGMGGLATIQKLLSMDPKAKVVASSGYSTDKVILDYDKYGFSATLVKPYKIEELKEMMMELLT